MSDGKWHKDGTRTFWQNTDSYHAVIFGSAPRRQLWAWAVWAINGNAKGISFSLAMARKQANRKIEELGEPKV